MSRQTLVAHFDSVSDAQRAADALMSDGMKREAIRIHAQNEETSAHREEHKGFWDSVTDFFMPNEDRDAYDEGVRRGGATLVAQADEAHTDRIADILERNGAVDIDERKAAWRQGEATGGGAAATAAAPRADDRGAEGEEAIPVAEEHLRVGKRQVDKGRVRVRSYSVETPVEEDVTLRKEDVSVERRPAERSAREGDEALFRDRTITAEEVDEEAVVAKDTEVKEEVVVKKDVVEDTQTVHDTVRHTEVDVEHDHHDHKDRSK